MKRMVATVYYYSVFAKTGSELCIKEKLVVSAQIAFPGNLIKGYTGMAYG